MKSFPAEYSALFCRYDAAVRRACRGVDEDGARVSVPAVSEGAYSGCARGEYADAAVTGLKRRLARPATDTRRPAAGSFIQNAPIDRPGRCGGHQQGSQGR